MTNPEKISSAISDKRRLIEIMVVIITGLGKFIFMDMLEWRLPYIIVVILGWTIYITLRHKKLPGILNHWGFRTDNLNGVTRKVLPFGLLSVIGFFVIGFIQGTINLTWNIIPILIIYPLWGIIQQFLMIALIAGNLQELKSKLLNRGFIIVVTAIMFAIVHHPYYWLVIATFILAIFYGYVYLRMRNIYVMGAFHGWLGGLFFYTVVNRDPFQEVFGKLINL